ncbi:MAG: hypothetical protein H6624_06955 [Bdellovibrionaceae bacterium]|nr:hypothetical protein [Bdellovibrionales bacterium]MCB9084065.1 hypothetical protein [Pseudobdellovibrionaceae bacterium]
MELSKSLGIKRFVLSLAALALFSCSESPSDRSPAGSRFRDCNQSELTQMEALGGSLVLPDHLSPGRYEYQGSQLLVSLKENGKTRSGVLIADQVDQTGNATTALTCSLGFGSGHLEAQIDFPLELQIDPRLTWVIDSKRGLNVEMDQNDIVHLGGRLDQPESWTVSQIRREMDNRRLAGGDLYLVQISAEEFEFVLMAETKKGGGLVERRTLRARYRLQ